MKYPTIGHTTLTTTTTVEAGRIHFTHDWHKAESETYNLNLMKSFAFRRLRSANDVCCNCAQMQGARSMRSHKIYVYISGIQWILPRCTISSLGSRMTQLHNAIQHIEFKNSEQLIPATENRWHCSCIHCRMSYVGHDKFISISAGAASYAQLSHCNYSCAMPITAFASHWCTIRKRWNRWKFATQNVGARIGIYLSWS